MTSTKRSTTSIADLVDAGYLKARQRLHGTYRGETVHATVTAAGRLSIRLPGGGIDLYTSPSGATRAAIRTVAEEAPRLIPGGSGWTFWRTAQGETLAEVRANYDGNLDLDDLLGIDQPNGKAA